jgi:hypothetical protein
LVIAGEMSMKNRNVRKWSQCDSSKEQCGHRLANIADDAAEWDGGISRFGCDAIVSKRNEGSKPSQALD